MWRSAIPALGDVIGDMKRAATHIFRQPAYVLISALTLALGIAVNISLFQLFDGFVTRPVTVREPERVLRLYRGGANGYGTGFSYPEYVMFAENCRSFTGLTASSPTLVRLGHNEETSENGTGLLVSANFFEALGSPIALGRGFRADMEGGRDAAPVAILGYEYWRSQFGADLQVVGRNIVLNGTPFIVVGVTGPDFSSFIGIPPKVIVPLEQERVLDPESQRLERRRQDWLAVAGRLVEGTTSEQAEAELSALDSHWREGASKWEQGSRIAISHNLRFAPDQLRRVEAAFALMSAFTLLVLLIAAANTANLVAARLAARRKEIGIRLALGAGRRHLVRELTAENAVVAALSGVLGLQLARWLETAATKWIELPLKLGIRWDYRVILFTVGASALACVAISILSIRRASRADVLSVIRENPESGLGASTRKISQARLVVGQVACSFVLLVAAGLLLRGIQQTRKIDLGFDPRSALAVSLPLASNGYDAARSEALLSELTDRIKGLGQVTSVAVADSYPLGSLQRTTEVEAMRVLVSAVSPNYFETLGVRVRQGRGFSEGEQEAEVFLVSESLARRLWPGESALGKMIQVGKRTGQVIGVAGDVQMYQQQDIVTGQIYQPVRRSDMIHAALLVRTTAPPRRLAIDVGRLIAGHHSALTANTYVLEDKLEESIQPFRAAALAASGLGILACLLALAGVYGLAAYTAKAQVKEFGLRIALGASRRDILVFVLREGMKPAVLGIGIGLIATPLALGWMRSMLFGLSPADPGTLAAAGVLLGGAAMLAVVMPAWRVSRLDPMDCLRHQ